MTVEIQSDSGSFPLSLVLTLTTTMSSGRMMACLFPPPLTILFIGFHPDSRSSC